MERLTHYAERGLLGRECAPHCRPTGEPERSEGAGGKETPESKENASSDAEKVSSQVAKAEERWYSPVVIQLARGANIPKEELDSIQGTGYEGRLSKKDIKDYIEKKKRGISEVSKASTGSGSQIEYASSLMHTFYYFIY